MKKILCTLKLHSIVDIITNSSTELFCVVKAKSEEEVQKVIDEILEDCECSILADDCGLQVEQRVDWDDDGHEFIIEGEYDICYEQHAPPCGLIKRRLKEVFEIVNEGY